MTEFEVMVAMLTRVGARFQTEWRGRQVGNRHESVGHALTVYSDSDGTIHSLFIFDSKGALTTHRLYLGEDM